MKAFIISLCLLFAASIANTQAQSESDLVITEIFYNQQGNDTLEFFEIYNKGGSPIDLTGVKVTDGISYAFPDMSLNAGEYLVVTKSDTAHFRSFFGVMALPWDSGSFANTGEDLVIRNSINTLLDSVRYNDNLPWDTLADGFGYSLVLCDPTDDNSMPHYWTHSQNTVGNYLGMGLIYASPGVAESPCTPNGDIEPPHVEEAYATAANTVLVYFNEEVTPATALNTSNYSGLGTISNITQDPSKEIITLTLASNLPTGTFVNLFVSNIQDTTGQSMTSTQTFPIVFNDGEAELIITEIFYNQPGSDTIEFIEVWNKSSITENIGGYKFTNGIDFTFPSNYTLQPQDFVVISRGASLANLFFGISGTLQYKGSLDNGGEKITLRNSVDVIIDTVRYSDTIPWPVQADGQGPSIYLLCPDVYSNDLAHRWAYSPDYVDDFLGAPIYASPKEHGTQPTACLVKLPVVIEEYIEVYPNPANNIVNISIPNPSLISEIKAFNAIGDQVFQKLVNANATTVDVSALTPGIYILQIVIGDDSVTRKLVVE